MNPKYPKVSTKHPKVSPKCPQSDSKVIPKLLQVDNVRAVLASSAISLRQNSHLEFLLSHLFPVWPGGMRVALESAAIAVR